MAVDLYPTALIAVAITVAGIIGIKTKISSSIFEVGAGLVLANALGIGITPWLWQSYPDISLQEQKRSLVFLEEVCYVS